MKNRVVRVPDEIWDAAQAQAQQEGTTVSAVIRRLLSAYVRSGAVVLAAIATVFLLGACGGAEPSAAPVSVPTATHATALPSALASQAAADEQAFLDEMARAEADECFSMNFHNAQWAAHVHARPSSDEPIADQIAGEEAFLTWIRSLPEGCNADDVAAITSMAKSVEMALASLRAG